MVKLDRVRCGIERFRTERSGGVAIMAGFMFTALVVAIGGAVDYSSTVANGKKAQRLMDSTVLALTRQDLSTINLQQRGEKLFNSLLEKAAVKSGAEEVSFVLEDDVVRGSAVVGSTTNFLSLIGLDTLRARVESAAVPPQAVPLEIALVLDVSGSMDTDLNGRPRIDWLKESVNGMLDTLEETLPPRSQFSAAVVPYSTSVNVANYKQALAATSIGGEQKPTTGRDVWAAERFTASSGLDYTISVAAPSTRPVPFVSASEIGNKNPRSRMAGLNSDIDGVRRTIGTLEAKGWTAGHIGMAWGLYALSNEWRNIWAEAPAPRGEANKVIVILSDGEFNTTHNIGDVSLAATPDSTIPNKNDNGLESDAYFKNVCDLADTQGITVYAVALALDPISEAKLGDCVANGGQLFEANNPAQLREAFKSIAVELGQRRLVG